MKKILPLILLATAAAVSAYADDGYIVLHVYKDQHIIHTADGADAGHLEYVLIDPNSDQLVSVVITGGVLNDRYVPVPIADFRFGADAEVTLTSIDREHLVDAPVIDTTRFTSTTFVEPTIIENTYQHFGADISTIHRRGGAGQPTAGENRENQTGNRDQAATRGDQRKASERDRATAAFGGSQTDQNGGQNRPNESGANAINRDRQNRSEKNVNSSSEDRGTKDRENAESPQSRSDKTTSPMSREDAEQISGGTSDLAPSTTRTQKESAPEKTDRQTDATPKTGEGKETQSGEKSTDHSSRQDKQPDTDDQSR